MPDSPDDDLEAGGELAELEQADAERALLVELADQVAAGDDDELDGCGARGANDDLERRTDDDAVDALVLFADVEFLDEAAVERRVAEWAELAELEASP